jgi:hypothetical protein
LESTFRPAQGEIEATFSEQQEHTVDHTGANLKSLENADGIKSNNSQAEPTKKDPGAAFLQHPDEKSATASPMVPPAAGTDAEMPIYAGSELQPL